MRLAVLLAAVCAAAASGGRVHAADQPHQKAVEAWRAQHEAAYRKEYVPLGGLFPLHEGPNTAGSATGADIVLPKRAPAKIGRFVRAGSVVGFEPEDGALVMAGKIPLKAAVTLRSDAMTEGPDELTIGGVALWVHMSGQRPVIRMRDPNGSVARSFRGFHWFPVDETYRVTGHYIKDPAPRELHVANQLGDEDVVTTDGVVEFTIDGQTVRLRPTVPEPKRLWFVFRDGTSGKETYETARFLYADLRGDGTVVMDFNEAYNPPCSFNPYTTCPLPLPENRLQVRILAGERGYEGHK